MTKKGRVLASHTHQLRRRRANNSALSRQGNAARKHFDIILLEALGSAVLTLGGTLITRFNTFAKNFTIHNLLGLNRSFFKTRPAAL
jgi:hypothetical protein